MVTVSFGYISDGNSGLGQRLRLPAADRALVPILLITFILFSYNYINWGARNPKPKLKLRSLLPLETVQLIDRNETNTHYLWPFDPECAKFSVKFAPNHTFPPRALVSFPGSGNSWLRYLIEAATGYFTGSVFNDTRISDDGLLGEMREPNDGSTIIQKTHHDTIYKLTPKRMETLYLKLSERLFEYKGVLLIRNPFRALRAYWNFQRTDSQTGVASEPPGLSTIGWEDFVRAGAEKWASLIKTWVGNSTNSTDLLIILYENLKNDPVRELEKIVRYLGQPVMDPERVRCIRKHLEGPFHRRTKPCHETQMGLVNNMSLDSVVRGHIEEVNRFLMYKRVDLRLNYTGSLDCS